MITQFYHNLSCTACAQAFEHAGKDAAGLAILFMLVTIIPLLAIISFFIVRIARREKLNFDPQYQDKLEA